MWSLVTTNTKKETVEVGRFATITDAARRIAELEERPGVGIFLKIHVETNEHGTDDEALRVLHHTGRRENYAIRRSVS